MTTIPEQFFTTRRLLFRPFTPADLDDLATINSDPIVSAYVGDGETLDRATTAHWIERSRENVVRHGFGTGAVVDRRDARLIGWAGIARPEDGPPELIYGLARHRWGEGLGSELVAALVRWAEQLVGPGLRATVDLRNTVSLRLLEREGFQITERLSTGSGAEVGVLYRPAGGHPAAPSPPAADELQ